jgi:hypothetical protein
MSQCVTVALDCRAEIAAGEAALESMSAAVAEASNKAQEAEAALKSAQNKVTTCTKRIFAYCGCHLLCYPPREPCCHLPSKCSNFEMTHTAICSR